LRRTSSGSSVERTRSRLRKPTAQEPWTPRRVRYSLCPRSPPPSRQASSFRGSHRRPMALSGLQDSPPCPFLPRPERPCTACSRAPSWHSRLRRSSNGRPATSSPSDRAMSRDASSTVARDDCSWRTVNARKATMVRAALIALALALAFTTATAGTIAENGAEGTQAERADKPGSR
jgi:hypothetical protein